MLDFICRVNWQESWEIGRYNALVTCKGVKEEPLAMTNLNNRKKIVVGTLYEGSKQPFRIKDVEIKGVSYTEADQNYIIPKVELKDIHSGIEESDPKWKYWILRSQGMNYFSFLWYMSSVREYTKRPLDWRNPYIDVQKKVI